jgi:hypothetical protein
MPYAPLRFAVYLFPLPSYVARSVDMLDIIMLAVALGFFALSVGYTLACDRL